VTGHVRPTCARSMPLCSATNADGLCTKVRGEPAQKRAVQVCETENASAAHASAAFEEVHSATALIAVGGEVGVPEDAEFSHALTKSACITMGQSQIAREARCSTDPRTRWCRKRVKSDG
jgi:hypothetical protein